MTMPKTAAAVQEFGMLLPEQFSNQQLDVAEAALNQDLPGALAFVERAALETQQKGTFHYLSQAPDALVGRQQWDVLVGYLARLFASPYRLIVIEIMRRRYGVSVGFVNCCIIAGWLDETGEEELWCLQSRMQLTPDC